MCIFQAKTHILPMFLGRFKITTALLLNKKIVRFKRKGAMKRIVTSEWHRENFCQMNFWQKFKVWFVSSDSISISKVDDVLEMVLEGLFLKLRISTLRCCLH